MLSQKTAQAPHISQYYLRNKVYLLLCSQSQGTFLALDINQQTYPILDQVRYISDQFKIMIQQLIIALLLTLQANASCDFQPIIKGIQTYPITITNSQNQDKEQNYQLSAISQVNTQRALAVNSLESVTSWAWNLALQPTNQSSLIIIFSASDQKWSKISCVLWLITNPFIKSGFYTLNPSSATISPNTNSSTIYQLSLQPQQIQYEQESVAVVFIVGVKAKIKSQINFSITPFRIYNQTIYINLVGCNTQNVESIKLSYFIFSPNRADFQAFGDLLPFSQSKYPQYFDISATVPNSSYKLIGLTGIQTNSEFLNIDISISSDYLLSVTSKNNPLTVGYLYLFPQQFNCNNCSYQIIAEEQCVQQCPKNTILVQLSTITYCKRCPAELHMKANPQGKTCICQQGFTKDKNNKCIVKSIPPSLLVKSEGVSIVQKQNIFLPLEVILKEKLETTKQSNITSTPTKLNASDVSSASVSENRENRSNQSPANLPGTKISHQNITNQSKPINQTQINQAQSKIQANKSKSSFNPSSEDSKLSINITIVNGSKEPLPKMQDLAQIISKINEKNSTLQETKVITDIEDESKPFSSLKQKVSNQSQTTKEPQQLIIKQNKNESKSEETSSSTKISPANETSQTKLSTIELKNKTEENKTIDLNISSASSKINVNINEKTKQQTLLKNNISAIDNKKSSEEVKLNKTIITTNSAITQKNNSQSIDKIAKSTKPDDSSNTSKIISSTAPTTTISNESLNDVKGNITQNQNQAQNSSKTIGSNSTETQNVISNSAIEINQTKYNDSYLDNSNISQQKTQKNSSIIPKDNSSFINQNSNIGTYTINNTAQPKTINKTDINAKKVQTKSPAAIIPITPVVVLATESSNTPSSKTDCSKIINSIPISDKCLCTVGYVNISNNCIPITSIMLPTTDSTKTVKASQACPANQLFSPTQNKCVCQEGLKFNSIGSCVSLCQDKEVYNNEQKKCICIPGYAKINGICIICKLNGVFNGKQSCYPLPSTLVCRKNYTQSQNYCIKCSDITANTVTKQQCTNCAHGFSYNGSTCQCSSIYNVVNDSCLLPTCGNGKIDQYQSCDDKNIVNGDGCSSQCLIESGYFCKNASEPCLAAVCGDGMINGGELCDDGNINNGDGCSSICLVQSQVTCLGTPSACFPGVADNLTLVSLNVNANNVFIQLKTPEKIVLPDPILGRTFFTIKFLNTSIGATPYCEQQSQSANFNCLIIYPNGTPVNRAFIRFSYSTINLSGNLIVQISNALWPLTLGRSNRISQIN